MVLGDVIGRGSFGVVYRAKCRGEPVAVKVVDTKDGLDQKALEAFRREVEIVSSVFSPHVCLVRTARARDARRRAPRAHFQQAFFDALGSRACAAASTWVPVHRIRSDS